MRRLDTSDTRDLIFAVRYVLHEIIAAGEFKIIIALEVEREGGLGFQREGRTRKGHARGQLADIIIGNVD